MLEKYLLAAKKSNERVLYPNELPVQVTLKPDEIHKGVAVAAHPNGQIEVIVSNQVIYAPLKYITPI